MTSTDAAAGWWRVSWTLTYPAYEWRNRTQGFRSFERNTSWKRRHTNKERKILQREHFKNSSGNSKKRKKLERFNTRRSILFSLVYILLGFPGKDDHGLGHSLFAWCCSPEEPLLILCLCALKLLRVCHLPRLSRAQTGCHACVFAAQSPVWAETRVSDTFMQ